MVIRQHDSVVRMQVRIKECGETDKRDGQKCREN